LDTVYFLIYISISNPNSCLYARYISDNGQCPTWCFYSAFTDKVERICHFPTPGANCYSTVVVFCGAIIDSYWKNLVALGGESWNSGGEPASDSCIKLYQRTRCVMNLLNNISGNLHEEIYNEFLLVSR
jgi:hypothetical protein